MNKKNIFFNKKGSGAFIIVGLIMLFIVSLFYSVFTQPFFVVYNVTNDMIEDEEAKKTQNKIYTVWYYWPLLMILSIVLWIIYNSVRDRNQQSGFQ